MTFRNMKLLAFVLIVCSAAAILAVTRNRAQIPVVTSAPANPRVWEDEAVHSMELGLAYASASPNHIGSDYYYKMAERKIYKTYPVYAPGRGPRAYLESLEAKDPEIAFDPSQSKTEADWAKAGEAVFDMPVFITEIADVDNPAWYKKTGMPVAADGTVPFARYVIRAKGMVEMGIGSCATCHTRVMPEGSIIKGAQGNVPLDRVLAFTFRARLKEELIHFGERLRYTAPWLGKDDPGAKVASMPREEIASLHEAIPPGVQARHSTSPFHPVVVPDLIGVKDRTLLDRTGLSFHRSIGDLMRYAALVQGVDVLTRFGDFSLLDKMPNAAGLTRYSDEQLYALALYVYSLKPPPNPNKFDSTAAQGEKIFEREGCAMCHTPPLFTNNKLTPVDGFEVPQEHLKKYDILPMSVGTDPTLALKTRKGTGYYKVPSLKGVWYRGPFEHNGSVATLEDWFDPRRLKDDYVPTGFRGYGVKTRAVKGHPFGLNLSAADKKSLIAYLKTL